MKVVIVAQENDNHTAPLKWALEQAGYTVVCWAGIGWSPEKQASISFAQETRMILGSHTIEPGDVVWIRRPERPKSHPQVSPADKKFSDEEYRWFFYAVMFMLEALPVRVVNRYTASRFINNKSVQLLFARACGLKVPGSLMSNSPEAVKEYVRKHPDRLICKAFFPHIWKKPDGHSFAVTETFELTPEMLPADEVLTYAPAIYQEMVVKQFDVRMVLLGNTVYSCSLHNPKGTIDWRQDAGQGLVKVAAIETPGEVEKGILAFAQKAGIAYGSFDFAVDAQGQWWFLEVNEGGQFLWLDDFNRSLHIQEKFLAFLTAPEGASREELELRQTQFPSWQDYLDSPAKDQVPAEEPDPEAAFMSQEP
jgi:glutathione synthase/RimK-type ligase-like ATP-grasp enzyme